MFSSKSVLKAINSCVVGSEKYWQFCQLEIWCWL